MARVRTVGDLVKELQKLPQDKPVKALYATNEADGRYVWGSPRVRVVDDEDEHDAPEGTVVVMGVK